MSSSAPRGPTRRSLHALDWVNFFLADVQGGIAPFLSIYLLASLSWSPGRIGVAVSAAGFATLLLQTPAGALIDYVKCKRHIMALAMVAIAAGSFVTAISEGFLPIVGAQVFIGAAGTVLTPIVAALTLGIVGYKRMSQRQGRNQVFNHIGNFAAAVSAGLVGYLIARVGIFYLAATMALVALIPIYAIREADIDHRLARGSEAGDDNATLAGYTALLRDRRIVIYAFSVVLFHFANAAMLPLVGQYLATGADRGASLYMSACIITAQIVMIPMAAFSGRFSALWGRKPLFLIAFFFLPIRAILFALDNNPYYLVSVEILDGISNGIFGVVNVLMIADLTRGTGRYNVTQGMIATAIAGGATLSNMVSGFVVDATGYIGGFVFLAGVSAIALAVFYFGVAETGAPEQQPRWLAKASAAG